MLIALTFFCLKPNAFWIPSFSNFIFAVISIHLAFYIAFLLQSLIASLCFWTEKASSLERLIFVPYLFLSGLLVPISAFPPFVYKLALYTPFPFLINFPAKVLSGAQVDILSGLISQISWLVILIPSVHYLWKKGVKRYTAMGA